MPYEYTWFQSKEHNIQVFKILTPQDVYRKSIKLLKNIQFLRNFPQPLKSFPHGYEVDVEGGHFNGIKFETGAFFRNKRKNLYIL